MSVVMEDMQFKNKADTYICKSCIVSVRYWVARTFEINQQLIHFMLINAAKEKYKYAKQATGVKHCFISRHQKTCELFFIKRAFQFVIPQLFSVRQDYAQY